MSKKQSTLQTTSERTIIIGDIHGCLDEFKELLKKVKYNSASDRLILTGDLISKGPYSFETLQLARTLNAEVVTGNHELAFLLYLKNKKRPYKSFYALKQRMLPQLEEWIHWLENLPLYIEEDDFIVVHAGLHPSQHPEKTPPHILTTIRTWDGRGETLHTSCDPAWFDLYQGNKLVVFGHWAQRGLIVQHNVIGLDSGCVYGNALSALILPKRQIIQIKARQVYRQVERL